MKQIVVMKALCGFADRVRCLNQCFAYCDAHDALFCPDWEDGVWGMPFDEMFEIRHVQTISKADMLKQVRDGAVVEPACWTAELLDAPMGYEMVGDMYCSKFMVNEACIKNLSYIDADILICNGGGMSSWNYPLLTECLWIRPDVVDLMKPYLDKLRTTTLLIHLRGTDRPTTEFMESMLELYEKLGPAYTDNSYLISDSPKSVEAWRKHFNTPLFRPDAGVFRIPDKGRGTHTYTDEELKEFGVSKRQLNLETLIDFFALALCTNSLGLDLSYFHSVSRILWLQGSRVNRMLQGYFV